MVDTSTERPVDLLQTGEAIAVVSLQQQPDDEEEDVEQPSPAKQNVTPTAASAAGDNRLCVETNEEGRQEDSEVVQYVDVRTKVMGRQAELEELRKKSNLKGRKEKFNNDSPNATASTLTSFFMKQKQMKQQVRQNRLGAISSLNQYRSKDTETPRSARAAASSTPRHEYAGKSSYSGMDDFFLKQRQMDKEWKSSKETAFHYLHMYRQEHIHNCKQGTDNNSEHRAADVTAEEVAARDDKAIFDSLINVHAELRQFFTLQLEESQSTEEMDHDAWEVQDTPSDDLEEELALAGEVASGKLQEGDMPSADQVNTNLEEHSVPSNELKEAEDLVLTPVTEPVLDEECADENEAVLEEDDAAALLDQLLQVTDPVFCSDEAIMESTTPMEDIPFVIVESPPKSEQHKDVRQRGLGAVAVDQAAVTNLEMTARVKSGLADRSVSSMGSPTRSVDRSSPGTASLSSGTPPRFTAPSKKAVTIEHESRREQYLPNLHGSLAPCEQCMVWASDEEKAQFAESGRSLRIMICRGGCRRNCSVFPRLKDEPPVRLCQRCYHNTHRNKIQEGKSLP